MSLERALELAAEARGNGYPNPTVGAVVVAPDGTVVGEGVSEPAGGRHAEIVALDEAGERARGATLFVTMEPCAHHGRTPPCVDAIVAAGVARVVAGCADPSRGAGGGAVALRAAGVDRYNHNLNTSRDHHGEITTTHSYDDRTATVEAVKRAGISPCSGFIAGMRENDEQIVAVAYALRELDADSIPVNFLHAIPGTPLEGVHELNPRRCLKILALLRLLCPAKEIRVAGGREVNLRSLQPLALDPANAIFIGDYLTTSGQDAVDDYRMLEDLGFEIERVAL